MFINRNRFNEIGKWDKNIFLFLKKLNIVTEAK